ncbi:MAG: hypothetical protein J0H37_00310, partial [Hyphomicrobium denitrificans]|nr:hypothetical protein [Hyphomicrobium denitrificans]
MTSSEAETEAAADDGAHEDDEEATEAAAAEAEDNSCEKLSLLADEFRDAAPGPCPAGVSFLAV